MAEKCQPAADTKLHINEGAALNAALIELPYVLFEQVGSQSSASIASLSSTVGHLTTKYMLIMNSSALCAPLLLLCNTTLLHSMQPDIAGAHHWSMSLPKTSRSVRNGLTKGLLCGK